MSHTNDQCKPNYWKCQILVYELKASADNIFCLSELFISGDNKTKMNRMEKKLTAQCIGNAQSTVVKQQQEIYIKWGSLCVYISCLTCMRIYLRIRYQTFGIYNWYMPLKRIEFMCITWNNIIFVWHTTEFEINKNNQAGFPDSEQKKNAIEKTVQCSNSVSLK